LPSEGLFDGTYARGDAAALTGDLAWLQAMLDVEAAVARACAAEALIPAAAAEAIAEACRAERFDVVAIGRDAGEHASAVVPLVVGLRAAVGEEFAEMVHLGATSQDILDTAMMLVAQRALGPMLADASAGARAAARLADAHRATPMVGRTLLQQALPTSFGLRAAGWMVGIEESRGRLETVRSLELAVQMGGPVGSRDPAIARRVAIDLGLIEPTLPWHAVRVRVAALACALGGLAGVLAKVARDVTLLAQDEIGELSERGALRAPRARTAPSSPGGERPGELASGLRGRSSAMAHKRNPVAAVSVLACARRVPGLVATILAGMEQEHERAAGAWQAEWGTVSELLSLTGSATAWGRDLLEGLEVDPARMRENLDRLARAGVAVDPDLDAASTLIDRALAVRWS
jgi:3-carboxy-cis,cis-muconate cycloisomerase